MITEESEEDEETVEQWEIMRAGAKVTSTLESFFLLFFSFLLPRSDNYHHQQSMTVQFSSVIEHDNNSSNSLALITAR